MSDLENKTIDKNSSFLLQGMFLATASIISRVIGLFYRMPLTAIIGKAGNDNYGTAFSIYNILLIISSYSLPLAMSKMVATRMADGKVKDTKRVLNLGLLFATVSGGAAFLIVFFGADFFAGTLLKTPFSALALKVLSPALLIVAFLGVFRGFFQGLGTMIPSAISQIIEQIINAIVSVVAAYFLVGMGAKISQDMAAAYGAAGGTLGTVSGALAVLLFLGFAFFAYRKIFKKKLRNRNDVSTESTGHLLLVLILTILPVLLSTTLYNISSIVDQGIYKNIALSMGHAPREVSDFWGVFSGQYNVLINIPLAIANAFAASIVPSLAASFKRKEIKDVRIKIRTGLRFVNIITFPCVVGFLVLAGPLMKLLFNDSVESSARMLMVGCISVLFYAVSTFTNGVLQGIDRMGVPVIHAGISLVVQAIVLMVLMYAFDLNIYAVIIANIVYAILMCILNERSVKRYTGLKYSKIRTYFIPFVCSAMMGVFVYLSNYILMYFTHSNIVSTLFAIVVGMISYFLFMIIFKGITVEDLRRVPKGTVIIRFAQKIGLFR